MRGLRGQRIVAVAAGSTILVAMGSFGAVAGGLIGSEDIKNQSIAKVDIGKAAVGGSELKNGSIKEKKLSDALKEKINQVSTGGVPGPAGPAGPAGPSGANGADGMGQVVDSFTGELASPLSMDQAPNAGEAWALGLPDRGTYMITANTLSDRLMSGPDSIGGDFMAVGLISEEPVDGTSQIELAGLDVKVTPVGTSTFTVSVDKPTTLYVFGLSSALTGSEVSPIWGRVAATLVSNQFVPDLAPSDLSDIGIGTPRLVQKSVNSMERQLTN